MSPSPARLMAGLSIGAKASMGVPDAIEKGIVALQRALDAGWLAVHAAVEAAANLAAEWQLGPFHLVTALIGALLGAHLLLIVYALQLRLVARVKARRRMRLWAIWSRQLVAFLANDASAERIAGSLSRRYWRDFSDFIQPYLLDFEGEDQQRLIQLMDAVGIPGRLRRMLRSRREWHRSFAAHLLGILESQVSVPDLRPLLADRSELVRYTAAEALMRLRDLESVPRILTWLAGGGTLRFDRVLGLVYDFGGEICPALMAVVQDPEADPRVRRVAVDGLAHYLYLDATWPILELSVRTTERDLRLAALRALVAFEDTTLAGFFEGLLDDEDLAVRAVAARALGGIGDPEMVPRLVALVALDDFWVANEAVRALLALGEPGRTALDAAQAAGNTSPVADLLIAEVTQPADPARSPA